jgi:hypothetical protein
MILAIPPEGAKLPLATESFVNLVPLFTASALREDVLTSG